MSGKKAFTLIELLIVVAIIAILAAIAVPNFLEAQTRSKVSRAKADLRSLTTAIESYAVDFNSKIPADYNDSPHHVPTPSPFDITGEIPGAVPDGKYSDTLQPRARTFWSYIPLTTPVAYMTSAPRDAFSTVVPYHYETYQDTSVAGNPAGFAYLASWGPDKFQNAVSTSTGNAIYDPTNGTVSAGDIFRCAGVRDVSYAKSRIGSIAFNAQTR